MLRSPRRYFDPIQPRESLAQGYGAVGTAWAMHGATRLKTYTRNKPISVIG
jgi:hypothetical protein